MALTYVVEVSFTTSPDNPAPVWVDISAYVDLTAGIQINRGRTDAFSETQPGRATLTLDNSDGRFTPGLTTSPYYPNVKLARRIRISVTDGVTTWRRFDGRVDAWPTQWAPTGRYARATITCQDRLKRLGQVTLQNIVACEYLDTSPVLYYQMGDPAGSTSALDSSELQQPSAVAVPGFVTFGSATGPGTDGITAVSISAGGYLEVAKPTGFIAAGGSFTLSCFFSTTVAPDVTLPSSTFLLAYDGTAAGGLSVYVSDPSDVAAGDTSLTGVGIPAVTSFGTPVNTGSTFHVAVTYDAPSTTLRLYLNGALEESNTAFSARDAFTKVRIGSADNDIDTDDTDFSGALAHVALYDTALSATAINNMYLSGSTGFDGDGPGARISRLARYAGVDSAEVSVDSGLTSVAAQETTGDTAVSQMREAETTDAGVLFISRTGAVTFHSRSRRFDAASSFTLTGEQYEADLTLVLDDFGVANDVTVTRGAGTDARVVNTTSVADIGTYSRSITTIARTDSATRDRANWEANKSSTPVARWPQVTVDPLTIDSIRASVFNAEISTRFTLSGLPSTAPASTVDLMVEGYDEQINLSQHTITFNCSPFDPWRVWKLDDAAFSLLGSTTYLSF